MQINTTEYRVVLSQVLPYLIFLRNRSLITCTGISLQRKVWQQILVT